MRINHSAITSSTYELSKVVEFDLQLGDGSWSIRIQLLQNTEAEGRFRCRIWQAEHFRIQSTFPMDHHGSPSDHPSDELIWVRFNGPKLGDYDNFEAENTDAALAVVMQDFAAFLEHTTTEKVKS